MHLINCAINEHSFKCASYWFVEYHPGNKQCNMKTLSHKMYTQFASTHRINTRNNFAAITNIKLQNRKCLY